MRLIGKSPIHPLIFYPGKIAGYIMWIMLPLSAAGVIHLCTPVYHVALGAGVLGIIGVILSVISIINLGRSTRLGLPTDETVLKSSGIYRLSRNPMYTGFNLLTVASVIYHYTFFPAYVLGIFSFI
ncbi:MAG TPA: methyltransferase, partial [Spirochaetota bacterium]